MRLLAPAALLAVLIAGPAENNVAFPITVASPNSAIKFDLSLRSEQRLSYRVTLNERPVIELSRAGVIVDGINLGDGVSVAAVERSRHDERYRTRGVHSVAVNRYNGAKVTLLHEPSGTRYVMEIRGFDDGVAFRYVMPAATADAMRVPDEANVFNFPARSTVWYHDLDGHYEGVHEKRDVEDVPEGDWAAPPVTAQLPDGTGYASITEAGLKDYAGWSCRPIAAAALPRDWHMLPRHPTRIVCAIRRSTCAGSRIPPRSRERSRRRGVLSLLVEISMRSSTTT